MILQWIWLYLSIGISVICIEWMVLSLWRKRIFVSINLGLRIAQMTAFLIEVIIWPRQVWAFARTIARIKRGTMNRQEQEWYWEGYYKGLELRRQLQMSRKA